MYCVTSLDLSAAFDTVDHAIFLRTLNVLYGVEAVPLHRVITCGVPQGSVLGTRLYTMYTDPFTQIIQRHGIQYHTYTLLTYNYM